MQESRRDGGHNAGRRRRDGTAASTIGNGVKHARARIEPIAVQGGRAQVLVTLLVDSGWHVSWRNPGETGLPTRLSWSLPSGVRAVSETWPVPLITHTPVGDTHTLEGDVPWLVEFRVDSASTVDRLIGLTLRYGVCRDVCIPEQLTVQGVLPARTNPRGFVVPPGLQARLSTSAGVIAARRLVADTALLRSGADVVAGSTAGGGGRLWGGARRDAAVGGWPRPWIDGWNRHDSCGGGPARWCARTLCPGPVRGLSGARLPSPGSPLRHEITTGGPAQPNGGRKRIVVMCFPVRSGQPEAFTPPWDLSCDLQSVSPCCLAPSGRRLVRRPPLRPLPRRHQALSIR